MIDYNEYHDEEYPYSYELSEQDELYQDDCKERARDMQEELK